MRSSKEKRKMVPHVNISGYAGAGKSTISSLLWSRHKSLWVPRITCRPSRPGEKLDAEYLFVSRDEFNLRKMRGEIIIPSVHPALVEGDLVYHTGILRPQYWPKPLPDTELLVSVFGKFAPYLKRLIKSRFINILLVVTNEDELRRRLLSRGGEERCHHHLWMNRQYKKENIEARFDYLVSNDGTPEETVRQIEEIARIPYLPEMTI